MGTTVGEKVIGELDSPTRFDSEAISRAETVYADIGGYEHSAVIANEVDAQLRTAPPRRRRR